MKNMRQILLNNATEEYRRLYFNIENLDDCFLKDIHKNLKALQNTKIPENIFRINEELDEILEYLCREHFYLNIDVLEIHYLFYGKRYLSRYHLDNDDPQRLDN